jgi:hypothetical protein
MGPDIHRRNDFPSRILYRHSHRTQAQLQLLIDEAFGPSLERRRVSQWSHLRTRGRPADTLQARKLEFLRKVRENLANDDPAERYRLVDEFRDLILGRC